MTTQQLAGGILGIGLGAALVAAVQTAIWRFKSRPGAGTPRQPNPLIDYSAMDPPPTFLPVPELPEDLHSVGWYETHDPLPATSLGKRATVPVYTPRHVLLRELWADESVRAAVGEGSDLYRRIEAALKP